MDEEMGELELGELDVIGMEDACRRNTFNSISQNPIQLLKEALHIARTTNKLGV